MKTQNKQMEKKISDYKNSSKYPEAILLLANGAVNVGETVLVHNPIGFLSLWSFAGVENKSFLNPHRFWKTDRFISSGGFPVTRTSRPVRTRTVGIFSIPGREEVPFLLTIQG